MGGGSNALMYTCFIRVMEKYQSGEIAREIERKSGEIGGGLGEIAHFYYFLNIVFVAPDGLESGGKFPFINLKEGKMGVGCVGWRWGGRGETKSESGSSMGEFGNGAKGDARVDQWLVLFVCACIITPL